MSTDTLKEQIEQYADELSQKAGTEANTARAEVYREVAKHLRVLLMGGSSLSSMTLPTVGTTDMLGARSAPRAVVLWAARSAPRRKSNLTPAWS